LNSGWAAVEEPLNPVGLGTSIEYHAKPKVYKRLSVILFSTQLHPQDHPNTLPSKIKTHISNNMKLSSTAYIVSSVLALLASGAPNGDSLAAIEVWQAVTNWKQVILPYLCFGLGSILK
jgi:hypothetical protein